MSAKVQTSSTMAPEAIAAVYERIRQERAAEEQRRRERELAHARSWQAGRCPHCKGRTGKRVQRHAIEFGDGTVRVSYTCPGCGAGLFVTQAEDDAFRAPAVQAVTA